MQFGILTTMRNFIEFVREQGVVGLAIGFLLGGAVSSLVTALVNDIINPLVGLIFGATDSLAESQWVINSVAIRWGHFLTVLIDFVVIASVVYFGFKGLRLDTLDLPKNREKKDQKEKK